MGGLGAIYAASLVLTVLMIVSFGVIHSLVTSYGSLLHEVRRVGDPRVRLEGTGLRFNGTHVLADFRNAGTGRIRASEFLLSDVVLRYRTDSGGVATLVLSCCDGWSLANVSLNGGPELLNPVDVRTGKGVIDPTETVTIAIPVPADLDPTGPLMVEVVTPEGARGVVSG
ncbi:MAG: hypothetical protein QXO17_03305 [Nitrososphaerota archaeon]